MARIAGHKDLGLHGDVWITQWSLEDEMGVQSITTQVPDREVQSAPGDPMLYRYRADKLALCNYGVSPIDFDRYVMGRQEPPKTCRFASTQWNPLGGE